VIDQQILLSIPGCEQGQPPQSVAPLTGGRGCNEILRVATQAGVFVVRRRVEPMERPGSDARREVACQRRASRAGLAPAIVACAENGNWLVMEFVAGPAWQPADLLCERGARLLGLRLAALHDCEPPESFAAVDYAAIAEGQLQQIARCRANELPAARALARRVDEIANSGAGKVRAIVHGDLQASNLVGAAPQLIDWEYAQIADPTYDIACLLDYYPPLDAWLETLLGAAGLAAAADRERLSTQRQLFSALNRLWFMANGPATG
jgi:aminoglycoside phosphotransferase (APT) family kinase protein